MAVYVGICFVALRVDDGGKEEVIGCKVRRDIKIDHLTEKIRTDTVVALLQGNLYLVVKAASSSTKVLI